MGLFDGNPGSSTTSAPAWLQQPMQQYLSQVAQITSRPYSQYMGPQIAPLTGLQQQAYGGMGGVMGGMMGAMLGVMVRIGDAQVWITVVLMTAVWVFFHVGLIVLIKRSSQRHYTIDPVCEMKVDTATAKWVSQYKGHTIHFCAPGCKRLFDKAPDNYPITPFEAKA